MDEFERPAIALVDIDLLGFVQFAPERDVARDEPITLLWRQGRIEVRGYVPPLSIDEVSEGVPFVAPLQEGQLFGVKVDTESGPLVVVFGTVGTDSDDQGAGSVAAFDFPLHQVFPLAGAYIELVRDAHGVPQPSAGNGAVWFDHEGRAFIGVKPARGGGRVVVDLAAAEVASLAHGAVGYVNWNLCWTPPGAKEPVIVFKHRAVTK